MPASKPGRPQAPVRRSCVVVTAPFDWKLQDVGSPQFQLEVSGVDALIDRTKQAGYRLLSVDATPIQSAFGRFVFAIDPDALLVEFVEPAAR